MIQACRELYLAEETIGAERTGELRVQDLEGDSAIMLGVLREVDGRHASAPELAIDAVQAAEGIF